VYKISDGRVVGRIANSIEMVKGYRQGQIYEFAERDLVDWLITKPDGSEEGNFVGKYLESLSEGR
jgi:uncharacterized protein YegJ (DUF2314 family)